MRLKIFRAFWGNYAADYKKLRDMHYLILSMPKPILTIMNSNQGFGQIKGTTKKTGVNYSPVPVCCFNKLTREFLWEIKSKPDGSYSFKNIAKGLECFVVAFDPSGEYNAVISDKVIAK